MSKEFFCHYLVDNNFCVWRTMNDSTRMPCKAEVASEDYDYEFDWCTPAHQAVVSSGSIVTKEFIIN